jgi:hypothetical protein
MASQATHQNNVHPRRDLAGYLEAQMVRMDHSYGIIRGLRSLGAYTIARR